MVSCSYWLIINDRLCVFSCELNACPDLVTRLRNPVRHKVIPKFFMFYILKFLKKQTA